MDKFDKQPYEEFTIRTDFSPNFTADEVIASHTVIATDKTGGDVTSLVTNQNLVASDGVSKVSVMVRGGDVLLSPYKITFRCVTSIGHRWEHDVQMRVKDL